MSKLVIWIGAFFAALLAVLLMVRDDHSDINNRSTERQASDAAQRLELETPEPNEATSGPTIPAPHIDSDTPQVQSPIVSQTTNSRLAPVARDREDTVITTENVSMYFYTEPLEASRVLREAAVQEDYDPHWSGRATDRVNDVLSDASIRTHVSDWTVDCHTTICVVDFLDSSLRDFDDSEATLQLEADIFERVVWFRHYKNNSATLFLMVPKFTYDPNRS